MPYIKLIVERVWATATTSEQASSFSIQVAAKLPWRSSINAKDGQDLSKAPWSLTLCHKASISKFAADAGGVGVCYYIEPSDDPEYGSDAAFDGHIGLGPEELELIKLAWLAGKALPEIVIEVPDLEYSWEPDGSGKVWDTAKKHRVITEARVAFTERADDEDDQIAPVTANPPPLKRDIEGLATQLGEIRSTLRYVLGAAVIALFLLATR